MISKSAISTTVKGKRVLQIRKLEKELLKISRRYEQVTDPQYISDTK